VHAATLPVYRPREPQGTLLHRIVREHYATLRELSINPDDPSSGLPEFIDKEFEAFLGCAALPRGFTRLRCDRCGHERLLGFSCKRRTLCASCSARRMHQTAAFLADHVFPDAPLRQWVLAPPFALVGLLGARHDILSHMSRIFIGAVFRWLRTQARASGVDDARCGAVTFIQRFSGSLLLFPHLHVAVLDGVYTRASEEELPRFVPVRAPAEADMRAVANEVAHRFARLLERLGFLAGADDPPSPTPVDRWYADVLREPAGLAIVDENGSVQIDPPRFRTASTGEAHGFSVHARIHIRAGDKPGRERLLRYAARPPLADAQLSEMANGQITVQLRKPRPSGQTHVVLEPVRLLRRLAWLVPPPRRHQIRFHGVLAPHAQWRAEIVPEAPVATSAPELCSVQDGPRVPKPKNAAAISWAQLLRRTYDIDAESCEKCGAGMRPVAVILDPKVACKILSHLGLPCQPPRFAPARAPP
jgi:hypothetical protein